jgi:uncharacterized repeat protein (TIGR01451 family)/fimbrial isopeptide formation D2 family protein
MTNSDTTSHDVPQAGARRRRFRPFLKGTLAAVVAVLGVGFFASPAFAHSNTVTGVAACPTGATQTITWTIANDWPLAETADLFQSSVITASFSASSVSIATTPTGTAPANYSTGTVVETIPATVTGVVSFTETGIWTDGVSQTVTSNVTVGGGCTGPDITVAKSVSPGTVAAGSSTPVVYTLAVTNGGQLPTTLPVTVTDVIPTGLTYVSGSASCGTTPLCSASELGGTVTFTIQAPINGGVTDDVSFSTTADATDPVETIDNTATYTGEGCTPTAPATTCSTNTVPVTVTNPSLTVVKSANTSAVTAGQAAPVVYTLTVSNPASQATPSSTQAPVTVTDVVPSGLTYVSESCGALTASTTPSCTASYDSVTNTVSYTLGFPIAVGASYPLTFTASVNASDTSNIVNTANWTGPGCPSATAAPGCATNQVVITVANFTVSKDDSAGSSSVNPGQVITYTLSADNIGSGPGSITVTDAAPTGTTLTTPAPSCPAGTSSTCTVTVSGSSISWAITNLPAGSTYALTFAVTVNSGTGGTTIDNTGTYTEPGCTTAGGCSTNTTHNPVPPPTTPGSPPPTTIPPTTPSTTPPPAATVVTESNGGAITGATTVHTGEPWAGSSPYVLAVLAFGVSLVSLGQLRRRRALRRPTA